ncbi:MAG TPA: hypothetical protein VEB40_16815 [Flavipsychrobacter sp.]|nr:hypothetical protein [Flavipsychrobacter sp.]
MGELFMTQHYYIRNLFAQHGLMPNERFMNGLTLVCSITGCGAEQALSDSREVPAPYTRHLWFWYMKLWGFSEQEIAAITGMKRAGIARGIEAVNDKKVIPYVEADTAELRKHAESQMHGLKG